MLNWWPVTDEEADYLHNPKKSKEKQQEKK